MTNPTRNASQKVDLDFNYFVEQARIAASSGLSGPINLTTRCEWTQPTQCSTVAPIADMWHIPKSENHPKGRWVCDPHMHAIMNKAAEEMGVTFGT